MSEEAKVVQKPEAGLLAAKFIDHPAIMYEHRDIVNYPFRFGVKAMGKVEKFPYWKDLMEDCLPQEKDLVSSNLEKIELRKKPPMWMPPEDLERIWSECSKYTGSNKDTHYFKSVQDCEVECEPAYCFGVRQGELVWWKKEKVLQVFSAETAKRLMQEEKENTLNIAKEEEGIWVHRKCRCIVDFRSKNLYSICKQKMELYGLSSLLLLIMALTNIVQGPITTFWQTTKDINYQVLAEKRSQTEQVEDIMKVNLRQHVAKLLSVLVEAESGESHKDTSSIFDLPKKQEVFFPVIQTLDFSAWYYQWGCTPTKLNNIAIWCVAMAKWLIFNSIVSGN